MDVSGAMVRRQFLCALMAGGTFVATSFSGCGSSENAIEMTPEAKKAINTKKVGDASKFIKPGGKRPGVR
jgi:hypothetical protein